MLKNLLDYNSKENIWLRNNRKKTLTVGLGLDALLGIGIILWINRTEK